MLKFLALWMLVRVAGRLPRRMLYPAATVAGAAAWLASTRLRATTLDHARHVAPQLLAREQRRVARGCVRSAALYWADFARASHRTQQAAFAEAEQFDGLHHLFAALDRGCGVIMVSAHIGSPEFLIRAAGYLRLDLMVLTEQLAPRRFHDLVHEVRSVPGVRFQPAGVGGLRATIAQLRSGGMVAVMADRDIQGSGRPVPFFGERALLPSGAVELALRTGAALVPGFATRTPRGYRVRFHPALDLQRSDDREADIERGMLAVAAALEHGIATAPDQWFALQPVWSGLAR